MIDLVKAAENIQDFEDGSLKNHVINLEKHFQDADKQTTQTLCTDLNIDTTLLESAFLLKKVAGQINVVIHSVGILISLPHILKKDEFVKSLSLGAGNTGRSFDLETNLRIAEFKFIQWKGGSEAIRQNSVFKDFYGLAEAETSKERFLYVVGLEHPLNFFNGGRVLSSVMSRNNKLWEEIQQRYGNRFERVNEYYEYRKELVQIVDIAEVVPEIADLFQQQ
jgi:hypothetical protein